MKARGRGWIARGAPIALAALGVLALAAAPARAQVRTVPSPTFPTIQDALCVLGCPTPPGPLTNGTTVIVKKGGGTGLNGEYHETGLRITKNIKFMCQGGTVISGSVPSNVSYFPSPGDPPGPAPPL